MRVEEDYCDGNPEEYEGSIVLVEDVYKVCNTLEYNGKTRMMNERERYEQAKRNKVMALISLEQRPEYKFYLPGVMGNAIANANGNEVPIIHCEFMSGPDGYLEGYYVDKVIFPHNKTEETASFTIDVTIDVDRFRAMYNHPLYFLYFHLVGMGFLATSVLCWYWLYKRKELMGFSEARIPEIMLSMEGVTMAILGFYLLIGGHFLRPVQTYDFSGMSAGYLSGSSLATSMLAGIFFMDLQKSMLTMKLNQKAYFWRTYKKRIIIVVTCCILMDMFNFYAFAYAIPGFVTVCGGINVLATIVLGTYFFVGTNRFLKLGMEMMEETDDDIIETEANRQQKETQIRNLIKLAKYLRISTCGMFLSVMILPYIMLSGKRHYGVWAPGGWTFFWVCFFPIRWMQSYAQICMCRPQGARKNKAATIAPKATQVGSSIGSSVGSELNSEIVVTSAESASSSSGSYDASSKLSSASPSTSSSIESSNSS